MSRRRMVYEGSAKILYEGPEPGTLVQYFKDESTDENTRKSARVDGKGVLNNRISEHVMTHLNAIGVPTHFIRRINMREQVIRATDLLPLRMAVRNAAAGTMAKRFGLNDGEPLPRPVVEFYLKDDSLSNPLVTEEHIAAFNWANPQDMDDMVALALRVNDFLTGLFLGVGIRLVDFGIECGRVWEGDFQRIIIADDITPDACRLWDMTSDRKFDRDAHPDDPAEQMEAYAEVARRLGVMPKATPPQGTGPKLVH